MTLYGWTCEWPGPDNFLVNGGPSFFLATSRTPSSPTARQHSRRRSTPGCRPPPRPLPVPRGGQLRTSWPPISRRCLSSSRPCRRGGRRCQGLQGRGQLQRLVLSGVARSIEVEVRWRSTGTRDIRPNPMDAPLDVDRLVGSYFDIRPDPTDATQRVAFGTSGHRGSALNGAFNEAHIVGHDRGDLPLPGEPRDRRAAVHRARHARALRARLRDRARGPGRARGGHPDRCRRWLHADPGGLARDPRP